MTSSLNELSVSLRGLARSPAFALLSIVTLAVGIAAVTAIFSVVDAVMLRPLPFREPDRLVSIWESRQADAVERWRVAGANYVDWRAEGKSFESLAAFGSYGATLTGRGEPRQIRGARVTPNYFETLGVAPIAGRTFGAGDDSARVAVLGYGLWRERFGASLQAIGSSILLDGIAHTVIGVAPDGLFPSWPVNGPRMHFRAERHELFVPLPGDRLTDRGSHLFGVVGRLARSVDLESARKEMNLIAARLASEYPANEDEGVVVRPLVDEVVGDVRVALRLLLGAAALVLLIACANVGGLMVARGEGRHQELAVRKALGADIASLARRFFAESLIIALTAAALGAVLAAIGLPLLLSWVPREIPRLASATIDPRALGIAVLIAVVASLCFALVPLALERAVPLVDALREGARGGGAGVRRQRLRSLLVTAQIALAVALTISAALLVESFRRLEAVDPGVRTRGVLIVDMAVPSARYETLEKVERFYRDLSAGVARIPGVEAAHITYDHPLESNWLNGYEIVGRPPRPDESRVAELHFTSPGLFEALGIPVVEGREFESADRAGTRAVALVNQAFARRFFGADDPVGSIVRTGVARWTWGEGSPEEFEIVGVVGDVSVPGYSGGPQARFFLDVWQVPMPDLKLLVVTAGDPESLVPAVRGQVTQIDRDMPLGRVRTLALEHDRAIAQPRFSMRLMTLFGVLALVLSAVGVFGLLAAWVAGRTREIGIRAALGAARPSVLALVLGYGLRLAIAGVAVGIVAAFALSRLLASQLHGITASEPKAYLLAPAMVLLVALIACLVPALRATLIEPTVALRDE